MPSPLISVAFAELADELPEGLLAPDEVERANAYKSTRRRQQFCLSRALTRALLEKHTGKPASSFNIATDSSGKPFIEGGPAFSVSHSRNIVTCVVADDGEVGIDLEFPGR